MKKNKVLNEINSIRSIMGLINEDMELASQASDLSKIQNLTNLEGINVDIKKILDKTNPICEPPKTGDPEKDSIIEKFWNWANDPTNKSKLKDTLKKLKDAFLSTKKLEKKQVDEQLGTGLVIAGITLTPSLLIAIGIFLIVILIIALSPKKSSCKKWKSIDDLV